MGLTVSGLSFDYPNGVRALDSIEFSIAEGEKLAVLGPNGAGKTTLLLALAGLPPAGRLRGEIFWSGGDGRRSPAEVGFLFQNPDDQVVAATVEDDVGFSLLARGADAASVSKKVGEVLKLVRLEDKRGRRPLEMSFGEKKRAGLAGVLISRPRLLCLDEPALGLDPREAGQLLKILLSLRTTMVFSGIDPAYSAALADRMIILDRGKIAAHGTPGEITRDDELLRRYGLKMEL